MQKRYIEGFPYEIGELDPQKNEELSSKIRGYKDEFIRVGPKKYFIQKGYLSVAADIYNLPLRQDDTFVVTIPKSGTTLCQELVWLINNELNFEKAALINLNERFPFLDFYSTKTSFASDIPSSLRASVLQTYVFYGPYFKHVLEAWEQRHHPHMLFLFYEEIIKDLPATIRRVAKFYGKTFSDEQINKLAQHLGFDNFKKNKSVNMEHLQNSGVFRSNGAFIRKGKSGDWQNYFDEEMTAQADEWIQRNLHDTDFRFISQ